MNPITEIKRAAKKMANRNRINKIIHSVMLENKEIFLDMITEEQLFEQGIRGNLGKISDFKPYSPVTIGWKKLKGQPTDRVTLRDSGKMHKKSFLKPLKSKVETFSTVDYFNDLEKKYGKAIYEWSDENLKDIAVNYIIPAIVKDNKRILNK